jgi:putative NADH-flavin reductase
MRIALLGATGFVGAAILNEALDRGHFVTAIVRHPETVAPRERLVAKVGDVYDSAGLALMLAGQDAVISAFNPGWKNPRLYEDQIRGTRAIIVAVKKAGLKRVLWVGGAGGLQVAPGIRVIDNPDFPESAKPGSLATIEALEQLQREPELDWSFLAPSADMRPGPRTGHFRLEETSS